MVSTSWRRIHGDHSNSRRQAVERQHSHRTAIAQHCVVDGAVIAHTAAHRVMTADRTPHTAHKHAHARQNTAHTPGTAYLCAGHRASQRLRCIAPKQHTFQPIHTLGRTASSTKTQEILPKTAVYTAKSHRVRCRAAGVNVLVEAGLCATNIK